MNILTMQVCVEIHVFLSVANFTPQWLHPHNYSIIEYVELLLWQNSRLTFALCLFQRSNRSSSTLSSVFHPIYMTIFNPTEICTDTSEIIPSSVDNCHYMYKYFLSECFAFALFTPVMFTLGV